MAHKQMSESFALGALLAVTGGFLDAYTYAARGGVFANAQTGNLVLLAIQLAGGRPRQALQYLIPVLAFVLGVLLAESIRRRVRLTGRRLHWRHFVLLGEIAVLAVVACLPQTLDMAANVAVSFVCSLQVESFRKLEGSAYATTMCTGNLRTASEQLFRSWRDGDRAALHKSLRYFAIILWFMAGAVLGVGMTGWLGRQAVLGCCGLLAVGFGMMLVTDRVH